MKLKNLFKRKKHKTLTVTWIYDKYGCCVPSVKSKYQDVWCVEETLTAIIVSLLITLRDNHHGYPGHLNSDAEYVAELNRGIALFEDLMQVEDSWDDTYIEKINKAYTWLREWLPALWD